MFHKRNINRRKSVVMSQKYSIFTTLSKTFVFLPILVRSMIENRSAFDSIKNTDSPNEKMSFLSKIDQRTNDLPEQMTKPSTPDYNESDILENINSIKSSAFENENIFDNENSKNKKETPQSANKKLESTEIKSPETKSKKIEPSYPKIATAFAIDKQTKCILVFIAVLLLILVISTTSKMFENILEIQINKHNDKGIEV